MKTLQKVKSRVNFINLSLIFKTFRPFYFRKLPLPVNLGQHKNIFNSADLINVRLKYDMSMS